MSRPITSTEGFLRKIHQIKSDPYYQVFYRGHAKRDYLLDAKIFRNEDHYRSEQFLYKDMLVQNPSEFVTDVTTLEKLVRMQHFGLPTRLLDLTYNPLVALFFACSNIESVEEENHGAVIILYANKDSIKYFDSTTAAILANLVNLKTHEKRELNEIMLYHPNGIVDENNKVVRKLTYFVKEEKPYFEPKIRNLDLTYPICVKAKMNNNRIIAQAGVFLLFGLEQELSLKENNYFKIEKILIDKKFKKKILNELDNLNINKSTIFPNIENSASYISEKYKKHEWNAHIMTI